MSLTNALAALDDAIPDHAVETGLRELLRGATYDGKTVRIELAAAEGGFVNVPLDATIEIVTKAFFKDYSGSTFGSFRAQVAIGGVTARPDDGAPSARFCFATVFFNDRGQRITTDFHLGAR